MVRSAGVAPASWHWHSRVLLLNDDRKKWCSHEDLHLELPPSQSGVHGSYTLRASNLVRHVGVAPTYSVWKTGMLLLHQCRDEVVAGVVSAPTSADFQPAAHLSEPSSVWRMVPRRGVAPRSPAYRAGALLLSYGGMRMAEHQRIALWTPFYGAAVFETVSSPMPDVLL